MFIKEAKARIILDSRRNKTIEVFVKTLRGEFYASAPNGKSKGLHERPAYNEKGISESINLLNKLGEKLKNQNLMIKTFLGFEKFENWIKKFEEKYGNLGANATYALETTILKALAYENNKELWKFLLNYDGKAIKRKVKMPMPIGNCIGGGLHSQRETKPEFQEFLIIPNEKKFSSAVAKNYYAYEFAGELLKKKENKWILGRNDENAWQTSLMNEDILEILGVAAEKYKLRIGVDVASSTFYEKRKACYMYENKKLIRSREDQIFYIARIAKRHNLFYIEDAVEEEDFSGFALLKEEAKKPLIAGDDLTVTNLERIMKAIAKKSINAIIIKPNQNGYLFDVFKVVRFCKEKNLKIILSHRSGETMDDALGDYAVGFQADFIKTGIYGPERLIKLRRVMEIEKGLG